ncbi:MAG: helix-turn-helix transcriptional regulator [Ruminiclostridium sp.]|nr:helix-turn-helix transcriptional regulator [Ruminiclostridium sp.]MBP5606616.1 helix-turn-helix transcriptional regulator [Ruminiclostridium sp.]
MDLSSIGGYIRQYRVAANMSQDKLAECSGVSSKHIGVLERSERSPSLETLIRIANALNISADMLLCDVLETEVGIKQTMLSKKIGNLSREQQRDIIDVVDLLVQQQENKG